MNAPSSPRKASRKRKLDQSLEEISNDQALGPKTKRQKLSPPSNQEAKSEEPCAKNVNETASSSIPDTAKPEEKEDTKPQQTNNTTNKEVADNIKELITKQWGDDSDQINDIRYLEVDRVAVYKLKNESFEKAAHILSIEYREDDTLHEKVTVITKENEVVNIE
eukprot:231180_1